MYTDEYEKRETALEFALKLGQDTDLGEDEIVEVAKKFLAFLNGKPEAKASEEPKLRILVPLAGNQRNFEAAYEVSPGRFTWASSRSEARAKTSGAYAGWVLPWGSYGPLIDVETGEEV